MTRPTAAPPYWLWRAAADIRAGRRSADLDRVAEAIEDYRRSAHLGQTLPVAFGLEDLPGLRPWHSASLLDRRDELIAHVAAGRDGSVRSIAGGILAEASRYETRVLARQLAGETPRNDLEEAFLELHRISLGGGPKWPVAERQLRKWLGTRFPKSARESAQADGLALG